MNELYDDLAIRWIHEVVQQYATENGAMELHHTKAFSS